MSAQPSIPPKPAFSVFAGLPDHPAIIQLREVPQWVAWNYVWKPEKQKWDKPPLCPAGGFSSSTDPARWGTYQEAVARATRDRLPGVGFVLTADDHVTGGDLDKVRDPETGALEPWAEEIVSFGETYFEVSPSGTGLRFFAAGKIEATIKNDPAHVELYHSARYLTLTGAHVSGTPTDIRPAPKTIAALVARVAVFKTTAEREAQAKAEAGAPPQQRAGKKPGRIAEAPGRDFFYRVNSRASANLEQWVPSIFSRAKFNASTNGYRVTSRALGRDLEEDLSITPNGTVDFGVADMGDRNAGRRTPIDLVIEHGGAADATAAAHWLCEQMSISLEDLGWNSRTRDEEPVPQDPAEGSKTDVERPRPAARADRKEERSSAVVHGLIVPTVRDRLEIALRMEDAPVFPVQSLPSLMRDMVSALVEHVQAPESLCAHSVLSSAALATQGLADIKVPGIGHALPLSLFLLLIAVSGERKSSCDGLGLRAVSEIEEKLRETYADDLRDYKARKAAYDGEVSKAKNDKKIDGKERLRMLQILVEPKEPTVPTLRTEEPTLEGLMNLLAKGKPSIGLFSSEGGSFLGGHGMTEDAKVRTITGLCKLYDNGAGQRVRANEITFIHGRRVSVSLAVQPRIAAGLLGDEMARDQGFVGRFLICMPDSTIGKRVVRVTNPNEDPRIIAFHKRMAKLLELQDGVEGELKLDAMTLSPQAWEVWRSIAQTIENQLGETGMWKPVLASGQRMAENIARIAGVLHIFCHGHIGQPVSGETMAIACEIGGFYLKEALRLVGSGAAQLDGETQAANELATWLSSRDEDLISPTIVQQSAPRHLRAEAKTVRARIEQLSAAGIIELVGPGVIAGKPYKETYRLVRGVKH